MKTQCCLFIIVTILLPVILACGTTPKPEHVEQEIVVKFKSEAKPAQISALETQVGLKEVNEISTLNIKVYEVTSEKTVDEAINACEKEPFVEYAEPNLKYRTQK